MLNTTMINCKPDERIKGTAPGDKFQQNIHTARVLNAQDDEFWAAISRLYKGKSFTAVNYGLKTHKLVET